MKLTLGLVSLVTLVVLSGCGEDSSSDNSFSSPNSSIRNSSDYQMIDITNKSLIDGIKANTGDVYKFRQLNAAYSIKSLTIANSATKKCKLKIIDIKSDWQEGMDSQYQFGSVFDIKSLYEGSINYVEGEYVFSSDNEDYKFLIYFASGGSSSNFVDFILNCEDS